MHHFGHLWIIVYKWKFNVCHVILQMAFTKTATMDCSCVWRLCFMHCILARQYSKNYKFSRLWNTMGSKRRLYRPFLWWSVKLFTINPCYATTAHNDVQMQTQLTVPFDIRYHELSNIWVDEEAVLCALNMQAQCIIRICICVSIYTRW